MLKNYLNVAVRSYRKHFLFASLNTLGLAVAFSACTLIFIFVQYETTFEQFHQKAERIFRPTYRFQGSQGFEVHFARVPTDFINELPDHIPEVEHLIRFQNHAPRYIQVEEEKFKPEWIYSVDKEVFQVFDFPLIAGNPTTALEAPYSIVLTEALAHTYFGTPDVLGKELVITGHYTTEEQRYTITGVMENPPSNTHLPVEALVSFANPQERSWWAYIYILLKEGSSIEQVEAKMEDFIAEHTEGESTNQISFEFQALTDIHLNSELAREIVPNGNKLYIQVLGYAGIFVLLIALINFVNLSNALSMGRFREVGLRKILGASPRQLLGYTLIESILHNLFAAGLSLLITWAVFPYFQQISGSELTLPAGLLIAGVGTLAIICGLLASLYPAWNLRNSPSVQLLRQKKSMSLPASTGRVSFKRVLLTIQFCASMILLGSAVVAYTQFDYLHRKDLGLDKEQVLVLPQVPDPVKDQFPTFKAQVSSIPGVNQVAACMEVPSREIRDTGPVQVIGVHPDSESAPMMDVQVVSPDFLELMDIQLLEGENPFDQVRYMPPPQFDTTYSPEQYLGEQARAYLLNETAMKQLGWQTPQEAIGQQIKWSIGSFELAPGPVKGIVRDYHQESLKNPIEPLIFLFEQIWLGNFLIKVETQNLPETISQIQTVWNQLYPAYPMEYQFMDELYNKLYQNDRKLLQLLMIFSGLALFIAFLGLLGLVTYSLHTRMKELAIRKVLGAQPLSLVQLMSKEYLWVLVIGALLAIPISYVGVQQWLENFAYRVSVNGLTYLFTLLFMAFLLVITISLQTLRGISLNPADTLRDE